MAYWQVPDEEGCITLKAAGDLSAYQFHAMKMSGAAETVTIADADGDLVVGVLMNKPSAAGEAAKIFTHAGGVTLGNSGTSYAVNVELTCDASGHFIAAVDNDVAFAIALQAATAGGQLLPILWTVPHHVADVSMYLTGS